MRNKYDTLIDKTAFVYGGNLGKLQDIPFAICCLKELCNVEKVFFLIVGSGMDFRLLQDKVDESKQENVKLMKQLSKEDYEKMTGSCNAGMVFSDYRFTIPGFQVDY